MATPQNPSPPKPAAPPAASPNPPPHSASNPAHPEKHPHQKALEDQKAKDAKLDPRAAIEAQNEAFHTRDMADAHIVNLSKAKSVKIVDGKLVGPWDDMIEGSGLSVGDIGYMQLDELGVPTGLTSVMPPVDGPVVNVCRVLVRGPNDKTAQLTTPSGADLIPPLNPDPDFRARFPVVEDGKQDPRQSKYDERREAAAHATAAKAEEQRAR